MVNIRKQNIIHQCFLFLAILGICSGCSIVSLAIPPNQEAELEEIKQYRQWEDKENAKFEPYLGKTPQEIEAIFGKPQEEFKASSNGKLMAGGSDLGWTYGELVISEGAAHQFFFKQGKLILARVSGVKRTKTQKALDYLYL